LGRDALEPHVPKRLAPVGERGGGRIGQSRQAFVDQIAERHTSAGCQGAAFGCGFGTCRPQLRSELSAEGPPVAGYPATRTIASEELLPSPLRRFVIDAISAVSLSR